MVVLLSFLSLGKHWLLISNSSPSLTFTGFFINYGASVGMEATRAQYRLVQAIPLIPVGVAFLGSFTLKESPRWLAAKDRHEEAQASLSYYRGTKTDSIDVSFEAAEIRDQLSQRQQTLAGVPVTTLIKEVLTVPTYRRRLALSITMQCVAQWSGGNGITYYIPNVRYSLFF